MKFNISLYAGLIACLFFAVTRSVAQESPLDICPEFQLYPTGMLPGLRVEKGIRGSHALSLRVGYNVVRHGSAGEHDSERGGGPGFSLGYKHYFSDGFRGWFAGVKNDFWFNTIDWQDDPSLPDYLFGPTTIPVVQPTAEVGFLFKFGQNWIFAPTLAFGFEINVKTKGEPTGEGAIFLAGLQFGKRF